MTAERVTPEELDYARKRFSQVHKHLVHLGPEKGLFCAKCGTKVSSGGGHGDKLRFSYCYCKTCDAFVEWNGHGISKKAAKEFIEWLHTESSRR